MCLNEFQSEFGNATSPFPTASLNSPEMRRMFEVNSKSHFGSMFFMRTNELLKKPVALRSFGHTNYNYCCYDAYIFLFQDKSLLNIYSNFRVHQW